jgi:hypothetical protein
MAEAIQSNRFAFRLWRVWVAPSMRSQSVSVPGVAQEEHSTVHRRDPMGSRSSCAGYTPVHPETSGLKSTRGGPKVLEPPTCESGL